MQNESRLEASIPIIPSNPNASGCLFAWPERAARNHKETRMTHPQLNNAPQAQPRRRLT